MFRIVSITYVALILAGIAGAAHADVYRWVDAKGQVQYSDRWVPGSELIRTTNTRPLNAPSAARSGDQSRLSANNARASEQVKTTQAQRAVQQDVAAARSVQCTEAKKRYEAAVQARRLYRTGANGEREYMNDAEIDTYRLNARADMDASCK